jgi:hypothetical protein
MSWFSKKPEDWATRDGDFLFLLRLDKDVGFVGNKCTCNVVAGKPADRMAAMEALMREESTPCVDVKNLAEWKPFIESHARCAEAYYPDVRLPASTQHSYYDEAMVCNRLARALHKALHENGEYCFKHYEAIAKMNEATLKLSANEVNADFPQVFYLEFFTPLISFELFWILGAFYLCQFFFCVFIGFQKYFN